ncbi:MAG: ABC transporter ATP-binding protein [Bacilli bacterium]|nr:ABC transporter ATP-binding protein [Erysipelotrichaceae bacterium]MDD7381314.1 ABC transporter ATP-binding protein [Bacillales bacterium]MDY2745953.1 ABC transporter ATP-binding protein [Bacilli bacterium]MDY6142028.1 ABC transporter ATP-binding protein [Bacilli bacterium]
MEEIISIKNLNKTFKEVKAVNNLSFKVKKGEFFAFLGINGAGKSTTISIMCGELTRDSGEVYIDGKNIDEQMESIKVKMGVVYQKNVLDDPLTVKDNLKFRAALYGIHGKEFEEKYEKLASLLDFADLSSRTYGKLSGGQKRRVDIARALIHDPEILILDEPTTGLDPQTRKTVWKVVNDLRKEKGLTVFLTTHYMEEVTDADYIVILNKGEIVAEGSPLELKNKYTGDFISIYNVSKEDIVLLGLPFNEIPNGYRIEVANTYEATKLIINNPNLFKDYEVIKGKMDDVFLNATGIKLGGE